MGFSIGSVFNAVDSLLNFNKSDSSNGSDFTSLKKTQKIEPKLEIANFLKSSDKSSNKSQDFSFSSLIDGISDFGSNLASGIGIIGTGFYNAAKGVVQNIGESFSSFGSGVADIFSGNFSDGISEIAKSPIKLFLQTPIDAAITLGGNFALGLATATGIAGKPRALDEQELEVAKRVYGNKIDLSKVRIQEGPDFLFENTDAFTLNDNILLKKGYDFNYGTLIHELGHVYQGQAGGTDYLSESLFAQSIGNLFGKSRNEAYEYYKDILSGVKFENLNPEQQAHFIEDAYISGFFNQDNQALLLDTNLKQVLSIDSEQAQYLTKNGSYVDLTDLLTFNLK